MNRWHRQRLAGLMGLGCVLAGATPGWGQTVRTWQSAVSDNFALATRWSPVGKPTGTDSALFDALGTYTITFTANESFGALRVEGGAVDWSSAAARQVNVTSINVSNSGTDFRLRGDVRVTNTGVTTLDASNGTFVLNGGRLTTTSLQVSQGTLINSNPVSILTVTGTSNIGGQDKQGTVNFSAGAQATFGNVNFAPAGAGASSVGKLTLDSGALVTVDGNLAVGNITDDNRQGIIAITDTDSAITQLGARTLTIGRIQVGTPPGGTDNSSRVVVSNGGTFTTGTGAITLNNLGHINVQTGGVFDANGAMTINSGGDLNITGGVFDSSASITVNSGGTVTHNAGTFTRAGDLIINGGTFTQSGSVTQIISGSPDTVVQNGGNYSTTLTYSIPAGSVITVTGAGSTLTSSGALFSIGGAGTQLNMTSGGVVTATGLQLGSTGAVTTIIDGLNSRLTATAQTSVLNAGTFTVRNAGRAELGALSQGNGSLASTLNVQTGATMTMGNLDAAGSSTGASQAVINVTGANSSLTQLGAATFRLGGTSTGTGSLNINTGGIFTTGTGLGQVNTLGVINVGSGGVFNNLGTLYVDGGQVLATAGQFNLVAGSQLTLQNSALGSFSNLALNNGTQIIVDNAELRLTNLTPLGGTVNVLGGLVNFTQSTSLSGGKLTGLFGAIPTVLGGRTLQVGGTATLQSQLVVDGGAFTANAIVNGTLIDLKRGSVNLTGSNLSVGTGGTFGPVLAVPVGAAVNVQGSGTGTVDANGLVMLNGGQVNTGGALTNQGEIQLTHPQALLGGNGALVNNGTITGTGRIEKNLTNNSSGSIQANGNDRLVFAGSTNSNAGLISATNGGQMEFRQPLTNAAATGLISGQGAVLRFTGGLTNNGSLAFTNGNMDVFGDITQNVGGRITISGGGTTTFYDDVTIAPGAAGIQASTTGGTISRVVFFGSYNGGVTGGGSAFIEGDHRPGNSPGLVTFGGDVFYGPLSQLFIELAGRNRGSQYDAVDVTGSVTVSGTLHVQHLGGFNTQGGETFLVINNDGADPIVGQFNGLQEGSLIQADNKLYQVSYVGGTGNDFTLTAVPEPTTWMLIACGGLASAAYGYRRYRKGKAAAEEVLAEWE